MANECMVCDKHFTFRKNLIRHMRSHCDDDKFKCVHCDQMFTRKHNLDSHVEDYAGSVHCLICQKIFSSKCALMIHSRSSHSVLQCITCNKKFKNIIKLNRHKFRCHGSQSNQISNELSIINCKYCEKPFSRKNGLAKHVKSNVSQCECRVCQESFPSRCMLAMHDRSMHRESVCEYCERSFEKKCSLLKHLDANKIEVECTMCDASFPSKCALTRHVRTKHPDWTCRKCGTIYTRKSTLKLHVPFCFGPKISSDGGIDSHVGGAIEPDILNDRSQISSVTRSTTPTLIDSKVSTSDVSCISESLIPYISRQTAFRGCADIIVFGGDVNEALDVYLNRHKETLKHYILEKIHDKGGVKWSLIIHVRFVRPDGWGQSNAIRETNPCFRSLTTLSLMSADIILQLMKAFDKIRVSFLKFIREGSGWNFDSIQKLELNLAAYIPL